MFQLTIEKKDYEDPNYNEFKGIIFTSANAIKNLDISKINKDIFCFCVGNATEKIAKEKGLDCGLITNGSAITKQHCVEIIDNLNWIRISVSGGDANSYNKVQGKDHLDRVIENISMISKEKTKRESAMKLGIRMLVNEENLYNQN